MEKAINLFMELLEHIEENYKIAPSDTIYSIVKADVIDEVLKSIEASVQLVEYPKSTRLGLRNAYALLQILRAEKEFTDIFDEDITSMLMYYTAQKLGPENFIKTLPELFSEVEIKMINEGSSSLH